MCDFVCVCVLVRLLTLVVYNACMLVYLFFVVAFLCCLKCLCIVLCLCCVRAIVGFVMFVSLFI